MPAEPKVKRRSSRKDFQDEYRYDGRLARELEEKRNRGEISCAECRRLKMKCDKQIPCQSCVKRGCATLCPNGSLATGQGTRFVLAATEHLHQRIAKLTDRVRQLELALAALQAERSSEPHPLLREDLILSQERWEEGLEEVEQAAKEAIDTLGTLSISEYGSWRFFGPTGGSESLLVANQTAATVAASTSSTVNYQYPTPSGASSASEAHEPSMWLPLFSQSFPFTPLGTPAEVQSLIESHLPLRSTANQLAETYLAHMLWVFPNVSRGLLMEDMLPNIYRRVGLTENGRERENTATDTGMEGLEYSGPHDLALLFMVFAIGALTHGGEDTERSSSSNAGRSPAPYPPTSYAFGGHYHQLACAALALQPVLEKPTPATVQTLYLMSVYNSLGGRVLTSETTIELTWGLVSLASHLAQTIGLHRDCARWGLSPKTAQRRRMLFWDLFVADIWQSLTNGRPPSLSLPYIDCRFPDSQATEGAQREPASEFSGWAYRFTAEIIADILGRTLTAEAPTYATIMELDRKLRSFPLPAASHADGTFDGREGDGQMGDDSGSRNESFERFVVSYVRETILLYIHRSFFAQALIEEPMNPLRSTYAASFLASYRASLTVLKCVRQQFNAWPNSCSLFWIMWTFAFSSAVVFGTTVTRAPRSPFAQSAMAELEQACILFSEAAVYSTRAAKTLPILRKLACKARNALAAVRAGSEAPTDAGGISRNTNIEDDELAIFAGRTRFVSAKKGSPAFADSAVSTPYPATSPPGRPHSASTSTASDWFDSAPSTIPGAGYVPAGTSPHSAPPSAHRPSHVQYPTPCVSCNANECTGEVHSLPSPCQQWDQNYLYEPVGSSMQTSPATAPHEVQELRIPVQQQHYTSPPQLQPSEQPGQLQGYYSYPPHAYATEHQRQQPASRAHAYLPNTELVGLGLAARDSRLNERWSVFMEGSGLLEGVDYAHGQ
ncbi:putative fungal specific transcription factor [Lyophyllum shimeji]|uniref:Fungal specific transcription factor n=1 Tax=Lyophyllum shimeji TaxID=47721 RepID=A0A9P3PQ77_LYOSH|nr:putative fungal specific transcription factor [Lyophyllum shimeji]